MFYGFIFIFTNIANRQTQKIRKKKTINYDVEHYGDYKVDLNNPCQQDFELSSYSENKLIDRNLYVNYKHILFIDLTDIPVQFITDEARPDGVSVTLLIPSNLIRRLVSYQVVSEGEVVAELKEEEVDSSSSYSVSNLYIVIK